MNNLVTILRAFNYTNECCYVCNPNAVKVYDKENDMKIAYITNVTKNSDGYIVIEIKYIDGTVRYYLLSDEVNIDIPVNNEQHEYYYKTPYPFDYYLITENTVSKYKDKVWPIRFGEDDDLYLTYVNTIDLTHSNYKLHWLDGHGRELEFIMTLSRDDIAELIDDSEEYLGNLQDVIEIMGLWSPCIDD